jgi:hypothetical protein
MVTIFNSTVYPSTLHEVPDVVRWGRANIEQVHGLAFITYRTLDTEKNVALDASGEQIDPDRLSYASEHLDKAFVTSPEVSQTIKDRFCEYEPGAYLGGTVRHDSLKWLTAVVMGSSHGWYGSIGKRTMEVIQVGHHLFRGTYLAYLAQPRMTPLVLLMSPWDKITRKTARNWLSDLIRHPGRLFNAVRMQSIGIIQAPDAQPGGQADMCDSCPDMTVWNGTLVHSCRMDEYRLFGDLVSVIQRQKQDF